MTTFAVFGIVRDGYGNIFHHLKKELRESSDWHFLDMCVNGTHATPQEREWHIDDTAVVLCLPDWLPDVYAPKIISFCMFESTRLPGDWAEHLNYIAERVIVPCEWNVETFRANGVTVPISVCPLGIDPIEYAPISRNGSHEGKPYTFLWSGTPDARKGFDIVYPAFWKAFKGDPSAQLVMHFRKYPKGLMGTTDANVRVIQGKYMPAVMNKILAEADCFVFPSRGEGWGLPPREAAATGLPVIVTRYGGLAEGIDYWAMPLEQVGRSAAHYGAWGDEDLGEWAEPNIDELAEKMRWCFENQKSAANFGENAATWLKNNQSWAQTATRLKQIVEP